MFGSVAIPVMATEVKPALVLSDTPAGFIIHVAKTLLSASVGFSSSHLLRQ